jgi:hypothetical protein
MRWVYKQLIIKPAKQATEMTGAASAARFTG